MKIFKYQIPLFSLGNSKDCIEIEMPKGAKILSVQVQNEVPTIWAIVNPLAGKEKRKFYIVGTGWDFNEDKTIYIGSFQQFKESLVWHLFEIKK